MNAELCPQVAGLDEEEYQLTSPEFIFLSASDLVRRGWTERMLADYLVAPDTTDRNPHNPYGRPMRLYSATRVRIAESDSEVGAKLARNLARRGKRASHGDLFDQLCEALSSVEVEIPEMPEGDLMREAERSIQVNDAQLRLAWSDDDLRESAAVEYLWKQCEHLEWVLDSMFGRPGVRHLRKLLRSRILGAISVAYPFLEGECAHRIQGEAGEIIWQRYLPG